MSDEQTAAPPPSAQEQAWQPIETAPQMRKVIVFYLNALGNGRSVMACYYKAHSLEMHDDYSEVGEYNDATGESFAPEGWYEEHDSDNPLMPLSEAPSHWMPLPSPPLQTRQARSSSSKTNTNECPCGPSPCLGVSNLSVGTTCVRFGKTKQPTELPSSSPQVLEEAERLLKDITPGEWMVAPCSDTDETRDVVAGYQEREEEGRTIKQADWIAEINGDFDFDTDEEAEFQKIEANAQFIAAAPRLVRQLLAALKESRR